MFINGTFFRADPGGLKKNKVCLDKKSRIWVDLNINTIDNKEYCLLTVTDGSDGERKEYRLFLDLETAKRLGQALLGLVSKANLNTVYDVLIR